MERAPNLQSDTPMFETQLWARENEGFDVQFAMPL